MKRKHFTQFLSGVLALLLLACMALPAYADEADTSADAVDEATVKPAETEKAAEEAPDEDVELIMIETADDLIALAQNCSLDTWSQNKRVVLAADLTLEGEFTPIPTFGGEFDGSGHTISGLHITQSGSPVGLFASIQESGRIHDLKVEGTVQPSGENLSIGGIAGENSGRIERCTFTGSISGDRNVGGIAGKNTATGMITACATSGALFGENMTGGIVGYNLGLIEGCRNNLFVNIESTDPAIDLSKVDLTFSLDLTQLSQFNTGNVATDTGGIAGYSSGTIRSSENQASIGYQHIGYNAGGIAGRSCGQIYDCTNTGSVCGRKDVGGIVGQMEPYISMQLSETSVGKLEKQLDELNKLVDAAATHAESGSDDITSRLNSISGAVDNAAGAVNDIKLTAGIDTIVTGEGRHDSNTDLTGDLTPVIDDSDSGIHISKNPDSGKVNVDVDLPDVSLDASGSIDHTGIASGIVNGNTQIVAAPDLGGLASAVSSISGQLSMLNGAVSGTVGTVADDVRKINDKFGEVSQTIFDAVNEAQNGISDVITDTSATDVESITFGKISSCENEGIIYGDINTGGVAGSMAIEYELDPEDDVTQSLSSEYRRQYEYKAVILRCTNGGEVTSKRTYAGGICGRMDLGLISRCEGYGRVTSEDGSYVGGIAGVTAATVRECFAKTTLNGQKYVGGIVGSGVSEMLSGDGSTVAGCYALVEINNCTQYSGAISGAEAGTFLENYYVASDEALAGMNRQSFAGRAEPITFEQLLDIPGLPQQMQTFTLRFVVDGETVFSSSFDYGASFDDDTFPSIPKKAGYLAAWDRDKLQNLCFDTTVTAVYTQYTPALSSIDVREDGRAVMLAGGDYSEEDTLSIASEAMTPGAFHVQSGTLGNHLSAYLKTFGTSAFSLITANWDMVEQWRITVPVGESSEHTIRYLPPDGQTKNLRVYTRDTAGWEKADCEMIGSYLVFSVDAGETEIAILRTFAVWWLWAALAALIAAIVVLCIHFIRKAAKRARARRKAEILAAVGGPELAEEDLAHIDLTAAETAADNSPDAAAAAADDAHTAKSGEDAELLARAELAESRLAQAEEELRALREQGSAPAAPKSKKKFKWWIPVVIAAVLAAGAAAFFLVRGGVADELEAYCLLHNLDEKQQLSMTLSVSAELGGTELDTTADIQRTKLDNTRVTVVQRDGLALYYANGTVYLENGKAYQVGGEMPDYAQLLPQAAELYRLIDVTRTKDGSQTTYDITAAGSDGASKLLAILVPQLSQVLTLDTMQLSLIERDGAAAQLHFWADSVDLSLDAVLTVDEAAKKTPEIPNAVADAIRAGTSGESSVTLGLYQLLSAWSAQLSQDTVSADLKLSADCGPVVVSDTLQYDLKRVSGLSIGSIRREPLSLYFSGDSVCDADGNIVTVNTESLLDAAKLIDIAYQLVQNGTVSSRTSGSTTEYTLALDDDGMLALAQTIAPQVSPQSLLLRAGELVMQVEDGTLTSVQVNCSGEIHIALSQARAGLGATITFVSREVVIPQRALEALRSAS